MADLFISYQRSDEPRVARLVGLLEAAGLSVWWDKHLPGGGDWRAQIERELERARVVIVCWSQDSVGSAGGFVRDEASRAGNRLFPVLLDRVKPPLGFGETQGFDLSDWRGSRTDLAFIDLLQAVRARIEGRQQPKPRARTVRALRRFAFGGGILAALAITASFAWTAPSVRAAICSTPVAQPNLSRACCTAGFTPPVAVRGSGLAVRSVEKIGYLRQGSAPEMSEQAAQVRAMQQLKEDAQLLCGSGVDTERLSSVSPRVTQFHCHQLREGVVCAADYVARCTYEFHPLVTKCE